MEEDLSAPVATRRFAAEQADRLLGRLAVQVARTIKSGGASEVHDLRVAIRRFVRVLAALKPCFPRGESRAIRRALKRIMVQAGDVRDRDIALSLLAELVPEESASLSRDIRVERDAAAKVLTASLKRWVRSGASATWREGLKGEDAEGDFASQGVEVTARLVLPKAARKYFKAGKDAARDKAGAEALHRFRMAAKNLRYTLDLFSPLRGAAVNGLQQQLKDVQALLGAINDCATVRRMVSRRGGGEEILAALKKRQRRKVRQFRQRWTAAFSSAAAIRRWTESLSRWGHSAGATKKPPARSVPAAFAARGSASA